MRLWTIRSQQLRALETARERAFEDRAVARQRATYPEKCATLDEEAIRASFRTALAKRSDYRFDSEETVFAWLDLMYLLGFEFEEAPRCAWAKAILTDFDLGARTRLLLTVERARLQLKEEEK
ncbi:MAG: hypothetical protein E6J78_19450 [Deltaproteobacteria bacterium]|nr:MAG: hypothetical protein E6J78_19450 [Deltaproteobacteria bacterium]